MVGQEGHHSWATPGSIDGCLTGAFREESLECVDPNCRCAVKVTRSGRGWRVGTFQSTWEGDLGSHSRECESKSGCPFQTRRMDLHRMDDDFMLHRVEGGYEGEKAIARSLSLLRPGTSDIRILCSSDRYSADPATRHIKGMLSVPMYPTAAAGASLVRVSTTPAPEETDAAWRRYQGRSAVIGSSLYNMKGTSYSVLSLDSLQSRFSSLPRTVGGKVVNGNATVWCLAAFDESLYCGLSSYPTENKYLHRYTPDSDTWEAIPLPKEGFSHGLSNLVVVRGALHLFSIRSRLHSVPRYEALLSAKPSTHYTYTPQHGLVYEGTVPVGVDWSNAKVLGDCIVFFGRCAFHVYDCISGEWGKGWPEEEDPAEARENALVVDATHVGVYTDTRMLFASCLVADERRLYPHPSLKWAECQLPL
ncbi:hypothetical protein KIPB_001344 [Kipferlia bialata]|uniref:Uncharacterized protein n=1 Tax=Kipferlia bialata TaxID=797122 RepID=A0A9K3GFW2_9EUKA|nr:hypothetical protein KIPB_001344 [Kipferlia bialata]|eukprot:g1344.t1